MAADDFVLPPDTAVERADIRAPSKARATFTMKARPTVATDVLIRRPPESTI